MIDALGCLDRNKTLRAAIAEHGSIAILGGRSDRVPIETWVTPDGAWAVVIDMPGGWVCAVSTGDGFGAHEEWGA